MKKLLILASILLVLTLVFVACSEKNPGEETSGENVTVGNPVTDTPTEGPTEEPTDHPVVTETPTETPTEEPTEEPTKDSVVTETPTEAPSETLETPTETPTEEPTEPPVEDLDAPVYAVGSVVLADYASQTGDAWYMMHLEVPEVMSEGTRTFARMIPNGPDPYFVITESIVDRQIGRYMAISYRTNITTFGTMFLGYGACWNGVDDIVYVDWNEDENWNLVIIDLLQTDITAFTGDIINYGRFSIYEHYNGYEAKPEDYFDIEYVAFFNSDEAAEKYDAEMHKVPMWDEDHSIVVHQSFDQLYTGTGDAGNGPENVFEPGKSAEWNHVVDLTAGGVDTLTYWGWIGYYGDLGQFGYQINGGSAVYNADFAFVGADHEGIIAAAQGSGADSGHRMKIAISLAGLDGENTVRVLYKDADGYEVCLNEFTVKLVAHEHNHEAVVTAPTCTEAGYTTYTCACGDSYVADEVAAQGHSYVDGACSVCGEIDPDSIDPDAIVPAYLAKPEQLSAWASMTGDAWHCMDIVSSTMTIEDGRNFARIRVSNWDPYFVINETHNETHIGRYMAISYRTNIPATGRLLMGVGECWNNVDDLIDVDWNEDGNWHLMIIDVHAALPALANNIITYGRFSIYENSDAYLGQATDYFDIEYIAFFDTEEDAQKYDAELDRNHIHEHNHEAVVTAPTCTEAGYTTYTCACGDSYVADEVAAQGHSYVDGACSVCGAIDPEYDVPAGPVSPAYLAKPEQLSAWASMAGDAWHCWDIVSSTMTVEDGRNFARIRVSNWDPYFVINETHNETKIGRYMAISYRTNIPATGRLLMGVGECWNNVDDLIDVDWNEDGNWHLMIIDVHAALPALANNIITYGRFSIYENSDAYLGQATDYFDIEYIAFFDTEEDAQKYDADLDRTPAVEPEEPVGPVAPAYLAKPEQLSAWASMAGDAWHCWDIVSSTMTVEDGRNFARIRVSNWDPYFVINETHNETHIGRYMAISYRTNIPATGRLLMGVGECWNNVDDLIDVDWNEDGNWHLMIIDVHAALPALANNIITYGRFSIYENSDAYLGQATDYFDIEYIAFFDTEEDAQKYDAVLDRTHTHEHDHKAVVTAPTCTEAGYTTYTCSCGDSYVVDEVAALGHTYVNGACSVCGGLDPDSIDPDTIVPTYLATAEQLSAWASMTGDAWHSMDIVSSTVTEEDGRTFASMRVHNADPYFVINETHNETQIGRYMAISYRTNIAAKGRLLIGVGACWNNVDDVIILDWNEDENWNVMIIDMHAALPALSNNLITYGRLSIFDNSNMYLGQETDYFDIEYVMFFDAE